LFNFLFVFSIKDIYKYIKDPNYPMKTVTAELSKLSIWFPADRLFIDIEKKIAGFILFKTKQEKTRLTLLDY